MFWFRSQPGLLTPEDAWRKKIKWLGFLKTELPTVKMKNPKTAMTIKVD
jgi:hypothetical protein